MKKDSIKEELNKIFDGVISGTITPLESVKQLRLIKNKCEIEKKDLCKLMMSTDKKPCTCKRLHKVVIASRMCEEIIQFYQENGNIETIKCSKAFKELTPEQQNDVLEWEQYKKDNPLINA